MNDITARPFPLADSGHRSATARLWRLALLILAAAGLVALATILLGGDRPDPAPRIEGNGITRLVGPATYAAELDGANRNVRNAEGRLESAPDQWLRRESYAGALARRAAITGSYEDLKTVDDLLAQAFRDAPEGAGPVIGAAAHALTVHRLDDATRYLDMADRFAVQPPAAERAEWLGMRGDIAMYRGDYDAARRYYRASARMGEDVNSLTRLSTLELKRGQFDAAAELIGRAGASARTPNPYLAAFLYLRLADIGYASGDWAMAEKNIAAANAAFSGWWLAEAYRAQLLALNGDIDGAVALYAAVAEKSGDPLVMDALASLLRANGRIADSRVWAVRAQAIWDARLAMLPSAARGHAIEHELALGDARRALRLAEADYAARPHGQTAIMLATAQLANGQAAKARDLLRRTERSGWVSARAAALLAQAEALLGDGKASDAAREKALAIDPRIFDPAQSYIWFGHG